jgi:hypothetical protein
MAAYGSAVLMPSLRRTVRANRMAFVRPVSKTTVSGEALTAAGARTRHIRQSLKVAIMAVDAYWGVCSLLAVGLALVAWLDLREVSRNYANARRSLWKEVSKPTPNDEPKRN